MQRKIARLLNKIIVMFYINIRMSSVWRRLLCCLFDCRLFSNAFMFISTASQRNVSSSSVKGDITLLWELSKFDPPPQNPNPSSDYDKTLHMRQTRTVTQNWYKSAAREHLAKYVKYKASLYFYFFPRTRLLKWPVGRFWRTMAQITRHDARMCLLGVRTTAYHI